MTLAFTGKTVKGPDGGREVTHSKVFLRLYKMNLLEEVRKQGVCVSYKAFNRLVGRDAGCLLSQIAYWYLQPDKQGNSKLRRKFNGELWIAKTRAEWMDETDLTEAKLKASLKKLCDLQIIVKEVHKFGQDTVTHIRLVTDVLRELLVHQQLQDELQEEQSPFYDGEINQSGMANLPNALIQESTSVDYPSGVTNTPTLVPLTMATGEKTTMKAEELKAAFDAGVSTKTKKPSKWGKPVPTYGAETAAIAWCRYMKGIGIPWVKPLVKDEKNHLSWFIKTVGPELADSRMRWAIENWHDYVSQIRIDKGIDGLPQSPCTWVLAKYPDVIMQSIARAEKEKAGWSKPVPKPMNPLQAVKPTPDAVETGTLPIKKKSKFAQLTDDEIAKKV